MHTKKPLSIGFVALLLLSLVMLVTPTSAIPAPAGEGVVWLEPLYVNGSAVGVGNTFTVELWANISETAGGTGTPPVYGCFAYAYWFDWDDTLIEIVSYSVYPPTDIWTEGIFTAEDALQDTDLNTKNDRHSYSVTALGTPPGWKDARKIAEYTFKVLYEPVFPEPDVTSVLDITDQGFADDTESPITMTVYDGTYEVFAVPPPVPKLEVKDPRDHDNEIERCDFPLGSKFNVTINIKDLHWAKYLRAWEAKLSFDTTLLNVSGAYNGTFFEHFGPLGVYYVNVTYEEAGYVHIAGTMLGDPAYEPGTSPPMPFNETYNMAQGVLMYVEFLVTNISVAPVMYECEIGLYDTKLVNSTDQPIEHEIQANLTYYACYTTIGWYLDLTTDAYRHYSWTTYVGTGPNMTADAYAPQDLVILYAYLEYNKEPEINKLVMFEIHGPPNPYFNISIIRIAYTNASGIATIDFTIPWPSEHAEDMVFGHWDAYAAADVKIYQKAEDWLWFKVGWIIEITDVSVTVPEGQEGAKRCEWVEIAVTYKNIAFIPKQVLFTVVVYDELLDPIQEETWWVEVPGAPYGLCNEFSNSTTVYSHIPLWAHVGLATVYVNAFTALPMDCGVPYCPEATATFWIVTTADP